MADAVLDAANATLPESLHLKRGYERHAPEVARIAAFNFDAARPFLAKRLIDDPAEQDRFFDAFRQFVASRRARITPISWRYRHSPTFWVDQVWHAIIDAGLWEEFCLKIFGHRIRHIEHTIQGSPSTAQRHVGHMFQHVDREIWDESQACIGMVN